MDHLFANITIGNIINLSAFGLVAIIMLWLMRVAFPSILKAFKELVESFLDENRRQRDHCDQHNAEMKAVMDEFRRNQK